MVRDIFSKFNLKEFENTASTCFNVIPWECIDPEIGNFKTDNRTRSSNTGPFTLLLFSGLVFFHPIPLNRIEFDLEREQWRAKRATFIDHAKSCLSHLSKQPLTWNFSTIVLVIITFNLDTVKISTSRVINKKIKDTKFCKYRMVTLIPGNVIRSR